MAEPGHRTEGENGMTGKFARFGGAALASALLVLTACNASGNKSASAPGAETWSEFRDDFLDGYFPLNPTSAVYQGRSEEHTSELQSLMRISYAVFCWKKKREQNTSCEDPQNKSASTTHYHLTSK